MFLSAFSQFDFELISESISKPKKYIISGVSFVWLSNDVELEKPIIFHIFNNFSTAWFWNSLNLEQYRKSDLRFEISDLRNPRLPSWSLMNRNSNLHVSMFFSIEFIQLENGKFYIGESAHEIVWKGCLEESIPTIWAEFSEGHFLLVFYQILSIISKEDWYESFF